MSLLRSSILALLLIGWLPTTNSCIIAAAFPTAFADCCTSGDASGSDDGCCTSCAQFESGVLASTPQPVVVPSIPLRHDDAWLERLLSRLSAESEREWTRTDFSYSPPELLTTWQFSLRAAPAPRAPSLGS